MNSVLQDNLLMLLRIGVIPVLLISILLRNRRQKRLRAEKLAQSQSQRSASRRTAFDPAETRVEVLRDLLARFDAGDAFSGPTESAVTRGMIATRLAVALLSDGAGQEAELVLAQTLEAEDETTPDDRRAALMQLARLRVGQDRPEDARTCLSEAADLDLARLRAEARGDILHFADRLAANMAATIPPDLTDPKLPDYGPLSCLHLAGREADAREIATDVVARLDRALSETEDDPTGRVDGFPRDLLQQVRGKLAVMAQPD